MFRQALTPQPLTPIQPPIHPRTLRIVELHFLELHFDAIRFAENRGASQTAKPLELEVPLRLVEREVAGYHPPQSKR